MAGAVTEIAAAVWGFGLGFVGWGACFRLPQPMAVWLLSNPRARPWAVPVAQSVIVVCLILALLVGLAAVPLLVGVAQPGSMTPELWRRLYGVSLVSSWAGLVLLGILHRTRQ